MLTAIFDSQPAPPVPKPTGALLRPTLYNPPFPRYKPVQPIAITMMIAKRRTARLRRRERQADTSELQRSMDVETRLLRMLGRGSASDDAWQQPLRDEQKRIQEGFAGDARRARMVFTEHMLRRAKQARRARQRASERRAFKLRAAQTQSDVEAKSFEFL